MSATTAPRLERDMEQALTYSRIVLQDEPGEYRLVHPKTGKTRSYWGTLDKEGFEGLSALNAKGYGVFAVINRLDPSVEQRINNRQAARNVDVIGVRALFVDIDREEAEPGANLCELRAAPLRPSLIVRSSLPHKLQAYWIVDGISVSEFKTLQLALIKRYGADESCKNAARVMRVPGFFHTKREPVLCSIVEIAK
jgi:hypothetical protein